MEHLLRIKELLGKTLSQDGIERAVNLLRSGKSVEETVLSLETDDTNFITNSGKGFIHATATFSFGIGNISSSVEVSGQSGLSKSEDDWKIKLALDAANKIMHEHDVNLSDIRLSLVTLSFDGEKPLTTYEAPTEFSL